MTWDDHYSAPADSDQASRKCCSRSRNAMIICLGTTPAVQRTMSFAKLSVGEVNRAKSVTQFASGKSVNVARVLHTLGERCIATGIIGGDTGRFVRFDLDRSRIAHEFIDTPAPTRLCA